ncbi:MAG: family 20 glycosylhydrolase [Arachnia sp.]
MTVSDVRGVLLDVGRKRFDAGWIARLIEEMAHLDLNTLQLHLSDDIGLGVNMPGFEKLAAPGALTPDDIALIRARADACGVRLVPELDTPSHATMLLAGRPEWWLADRTGAPSPNRVDISNPAARQHVLRLWTAVLDLFEPEAAHLGGDEYLAAPWESEEERRPDRFPALLRWARAEAGADATAEDAFALFVTELAAHVGRRGCIPWLWNDHVVPAAQNPLVPVPRDAVVDVWVRWRSSTPSVLDYLDSGYDVINSNGDLLYFILSRDGVPALTGPKSAEDIAATFRPTRFMGLAGERSWIDVTDPHVLGAKLSVWCDAPDALSPDDTWRLLRAWLSPFAASFSSPRG